MSAGLQVWHGDIVRRDELIIFRVKQVLCKDLSDVAGVVRDARAKVLKPSCCDGLDLL